MKTFVLPFCDRNRRKPTRKNCDVIVEELKIAHRNPLSEKQKIQESGDAVQWKLLVKKTRFISVRNWLENRITMIFASNLCEFVDNDKISDYQKHISERYTDIIRRISQEVGGLTRNESEIHRTIKDINDDFVKRNFAGVIKEIALRPLQSSDKLMQVIAGD